MKNLNFKNVKLKSFALIVIALMIISATTAAMTIIPVKAQVSATQPISGPLPSGVTPSVTVLVSAKLSFRPATIGVNQQLLVNMWTNPALNVARQYVNVYTVTFTKPDGTTVTVGPLSSYLGDSTAYFNFVPDKVGTWKIMLNFAGEYFPAGNYLNGIIVTNSSGTALGSAYYQPSSDGPYTFTVQSASILPTDWPQTPIPGLGVYWSSPVEPTHQLWWSILGTYPATGVEEGATGYGGLNWPANTNPYAQQKYCFVPYVTGPTSAHIVWKEQIGLGGIVGGTIGEASYWSATSNGYQELTDIGAITGEPTILLDDRAYTSIIKPFNGVTQPVWECYNLQTGKVYWDLAGINYPPTFVVLYAGAPEVVGAEGYTATAALGYIGSGMFLEYNPWTGALQLNCSIAPLTTGVFYGNAYVLSVQTIGSGATAQYRLINWTTTGTGNTLASRIISNITFAFPDVQPDTSYFIDFQAGIVATTYSYSPVATGVATQVYLAAASLTTGQLLWNESAGPGYPIFSTYMTVADHGILAVRYDNGYWYGYNLLTGAQIWQSTLTSWPWGTFGTYGCASYGGMIFSSQYDCIAAINWTNGQTVWTYTAPTPISFETPYANNGTGDYSWMSHVIIANGVLYTVNAEHSPNQPVTVGWKLWALNTTSGQPLWSIEFGEPGTGDGSRVFQGAIADGYLMMTNAYDGTLYSFGMGLSATTVSAPQTEISQGQSVLLTGTVLDNSPAQPGTPCVSDASMETQMEYLHMQAPINGFFGNQNITGVPVTLTAIGSDNSVYNIGTVTSNGYYGTFSCPWTPPKADTYTITASFAGTSSYGSSAAATALLVGAPASTPTPAPTATVTPAPSTTQGLVTANDLMTYLAVGVIAIIIAIAIVGGTHTEKKSLKLQKQNQKTTNFFFFGLIFVFNGHIFEKLESTRGDCKPNILMDNKNSRICSSLKMNT